MCIHMYSLIQRTFAVCTEFDSKTSGVGDKPSM